MERRDFSGRNWEQEIVECLTATNRAQWGCLSKEGFLFKSRTLRKDRVPQSVINSMLRRRLLYIPPGSSTGMYKYRKEV